ncbi:SDR family oxidoreductase [Massilia yuzhufengensis]|uniref:Short-chain dehydrogenase n=1 Tax=Massilia yuzhufengensis TaxID=1164594 RepID=A0A1I1JZF1_9BURK|nr:SDR family oxidoreductase [Massilia yuzhufengensis]SFC50760.1 Short-chain dehydrogenase [Massilia yuzhufengensis]
MAIRLRRLHDQVMVITGATSGIGLTTARMAAARGARLVLAARSKDALAELADELRARGVQVETVAADVGEIDDVERIGAQAIDRFGRIDTWVNNAGISIFGRLEEIAPEDHQRLFQTNFWGTVNGSLEAVRRMKHRGGGAIINVGSEVSERSIPMQGMYASSKHAVKGFTDALRMELEKEGAPLQVTLVKPAAIDTMFAVHAKNYMEREPALPPPVYAPEVVADAILYCAENPKREAYAGGASKMIAAGSKLMPRMFDRYMNATMFKQQKSDVPTAPNRRDALYKPDPSSELRQRQGMPQNVHETSIYTKTSLRASPLMTALVGGGALFAAFTLSRRLTR